MIATRSPLRTPSWKRAVAKRRVRSRSWPQVRAGTGSRGSRKKRTATLSGTRATVRSRSSGRVTSGTAMVRGTPSS